MLPQIITKKGSDDTIFFNNFFKNGKNILIFCSQLPKIKTRRTYKIYEKLSCFLELISPA